MPIRFCPIVAAAMHDSDCILALLWGPGIIMKVTQRPSFPPQCILQMMRRTQYAQGKTNALTGHHKKST